LVKTQGPKPSQENQFFKPVIIAVLYIFFLQINSFAYNQAGIFLYLYIIMFRALSLFLIFFTTAAYGQLETNHWFYNWDRASVKPTGVTVVQPGANGENTITVEMSSSSMADSAGNLLFSCNGFTIFDRDQQIMPALKADVNLGGNYEKVLIQPIPATTRYLVFYSGVNYHDPDIYNRSFSLKYAIVDMSLNGGKGDVVSYNTLIDSLASPGYTIAEGPQENEAWLLVHRYRTDSFYAWPLNGGGIGNTPVISKAGTNVFKDDYIFRDLTASYDGKMVAGYVYLRTPDIFATTYRFIEVFNFDAGSGRLTNKIRSPRYSGYFETNWSLEFSPDSRLLYSLTIANIYGLQPCGFGSGTLTQFNPCYTDTLDFWEYRTTLASVFNFCYPGVAWGQVAMGADKKLHFPFSGVVVSQIHHPNRLGSSAGYEYDAYELVVGNSMIIGTPHFNPVIMKKAVQNNIVYDGGCYPNPYYFKVTNPRAQNFSWNFGDPGSGSANTSLLPNPAHVFSAPGKYVVKVSFFDPVSNQPQNLVDTIDVMDPGKRLLAPMPADTTLCGGDNLLTLRLRANNAIFHWYQLDGAGRKVNRVISDTLRIATTGKWYVEMRPGSCNGCILLDSITVRFANNTEPLEQERFICTGQSIMLGMPNSPGVQYSWNTGATTSTITVSSPGIYSLLATYPGGCIYRDSTLVKAADKVSFGLPADTTLCEGEVLLLNPGLPDANLVWQDGTNASTYLVEAEGKYWVKINFGAGCTASDSIQVHYVPANKPYLGEDTLLCQGDSLVLKTDITGTWLWSTGAATPAITVKNSGLYWLRINNGACVLADSISVTFNPPPAAGLGPDTALCPASTLLLSPAVSNATYLWQDGSTGATYRVSMPGSYRVQITQGPCTTADTIQVQYYTLPPLNAGPDISLCAGDSALLNAGPGFSQYTWSTGSNAPAVL
jgi:PKD repeat protein